MKSRQRGFTLIELMVVVAIILVLAAFVIPHLMRSKMTANETSALGFLNTLNNVLFDYWTNYDGYPASLSGLDSATSSLVNDQHSGYVFTYYPGPGDSNGTSHSYAIRAVPVSAGITGRRYFFTDQSGVIRESQTEASTVLGAPVN